MRLCNYDFHLFREDRGDNLEETIFKGWKRKHLRLNKSGRGTFGEQDNEENVGWKREHDK